MIEILALVLGSLSIITIGGIVLIIALEATREKSK